jgi:ADP-ribosylglycohydrolase
VKEQGEHTVRAQKARAQKKDKRQQRQKVSAKNESAKNETAKKKRERKKREGAKTRARAQGEENTKYLLQSLSAAFTEFFALTCSFSSSVIFKCITRVCCSYNLQFRLA